ncbi:MAG: two-component sensor histidine kinase, partial [Maribacter sp.]|nr:two-component sensor histidine kinase [Maribacter sp.]
MILLVLIASVLISGVTIYQYREALKDYHAHRLERKEEQVKQSVRNTLKNTTYPQTTDKLGLIFQKDIYEIADVL